MEPERITEIYIAEVVSQVPRRKRSDIAAELRTLITDGLDAEAAGSGKSIDEAMTVSFLRSFGAPKDIAARYHESSAIIDPSDTRDFLIAAVIGIAVLWQMTLILSWLGAMVLFFGLRSWMRRRRPVRTPWNPRDLDRVNRLRLLSRVIPIGLGILLLAAPHWVYTKLSGGALLPPRLVYDPGFYRERLPWLLVVAALTGLLYVAVATRGSWQPLTRYFDIGLKMATLGVLVWFHNAGMIFPSPAVDSAMKDGIEWAVFLVMLALVVKVTRMPRARPARR